MLDKIVYAKHLKICHNILIQNQLFFRVLLLFWDALLSNFIKNNRNEKKLVSCYSYIAKFEVFCIDNFIKHYSPISEGWEPSQGFRKFGFFSHPPWKVFGKFCTWSEFRVTHHVLSSLLPRKTFHSALKSYKNFPGWNKSPITIYSYFRRFSPKYLTGLFRTKINVLIGFYWNAKKWYLFFLG